MTTPLPQSIIWSVCHLGEPDEAHVRRVIDRAAAEGVHGIELAGRALDRYIEYRDFPCLAGTVDRDVLARRRRFLGASSEHARSRGLRFGLWHHEIYGPRDLLDLLPELRAADGLVDLDQPLLYRFITGKVREFLETYPCVDEVVLTLTETHIPVFRRPFCAIPVAERVRRVLQAVADATEPLGRTLVIRPFSAIREDELAVREAVNALKATQVAVMYKTEPFDWHPFLPDETLIGSVPRYEARAETDAGAEYYGQGAVPCSYTDHLRRRLTAALDRGARTAIIRVDRGVEHPSLDTPLNEVNVIAPTRWLLGRAATMEAGWDSWWRERYGTAVPPPRALLERTFEVMCKALYIDGHAYTHHRFPSYENATHVQAFGLMEEDVPLEHMRLNWGVLPERRTPTHERILDEKREAAALARAIVEDAAALRGLPESAARALRSALSTLPVLADACLAFCRTAIAHVEEMWRRPVRTTAPFEQESADLTALADRIERDLGAAFWLDMPEQMRSLVEGLRAERELEIPLRRLLDADTGLADYVLCGFAAEGHCLSKMLHSGERLRLADRWVRVTGLGRDEGVAYTLSARGRVPRRVVVTFAPVPGEPLAAVVRVAEVEHCVDIAAPGDRVTLEFATPALPETTVAIWSTGTRPVRVAQLEWR